MPKHGLPELQTSGCLGREGSDRSSGTDPAKPAKFLQCVLINPSETPSGGSRKFDFVHIPATEYISFFKLYLREPKNWPVLPNQGFVFSPFLSLNNKQRSKAKLKHGQKLPK